MCYNTVTKIKGGYSMDGYAIKSNSPFITSKPLKRTPPSKQYIEMVKTMNSYDFSLKKTSKGYVVIADKK